MVEVDAKDILVGFIAELDKRNLVLETAESRFEFMMEMYVTNILERTVKDPFDLICSNDVEDLSENTMLFQWMQQYTVYPIYDLYKLNVNEWLDQPVHIIEFQLKMAKQFQVRSKKDANNMIGGDGKTIMMDEAHELNTVTNEVKHTFKKQF